MTVWCLLVLATTWLGVTSSSSAGDDSYKIIVHPDNPVHAVERSFLRGAFLKTASSWSHNGSAIRPIDLPNGLPARERFTRIVLNKTPSQVRSYWIQRIFSGTAVPPPEAQSLAAVVAYVLANPGGLAYVPSGAAVGKAKSVEVE